MVSDSQRPDPLRPGGVLRHVLLALLIVLVLTGLGGVIAAPGWTGRYHADGVAIGGALEVLLAALLVTVLIRGRREKPGASVAARLRTALSYVLTAAVIVIPLILLSNVRLRANRRPQRIVLPSPPVPRATRSPKSSPPHQAVISAAVIWYSLLALLLLTAVVACVLLIRHYRRWLSGPAATAEFGDEPDELRDAVQSGQAALRRVDDTRAAIIACYLAMEHSLAAAGTARGIADTPDELLARAAAAGLVRGGAAAGLTALFYEARFSSHPMGLAERDAAERALGEIADDLRMRPTTGAADSPGSRA